MKILIVDDFFFVRKQLRAALQELGHHDVDDFADGTAAAVRLTASVSEEKHYDLILCDWHMPGMSGLGVLSVCRSLAPYRRTPFVLCTADAAESSVVQAIQAGATDYLTKPLPMNTLAERLEKILARVMPPAAASS
ncbi:MAG: response regulator [Myxococcales bacterium]|nr:response regulator [Myxococcales bacterium]